MTKIIEGRVFFDKEIENKRIEIYEEKFKELRDQMNETYDKMEALKSYFIQIAYGYLTNTEKSDLARAAIKRINEE
jgi:hypothetical protein